MDIHTRTGFFVDNELRRCEDGERVAVLSPATSEVVGEAVLAGERDMEAAVWSARRAFDDGPWPTMSIAERRDVILRAAARVGDREPELSRLVATQNGSPVGQHPGAGEAAFRAYAEMQFEDVTGRLTGAGMALVAQEPVGVVAAITPWNSPVSVGLGKVLPALLAGCTVVWKSAPETPLQDYVFAEELAAAGLPPGVLNVVPADRDVSEYLVSHDAVDMVSFTGSSGAGRRIGEICGRRLRRVLLELGGKSACIIRDDVDVAEASSAALWNGVLVNNGQSCMAWSRVLVPEAKLDEFVSAMSEVMSTAVIGDPLDPATQIGPLISERQRDRVEAYVAGAIAAGGTVAVGGGRPEGFERGWYVEPTLIHGLGNGAEINQEEVFGPVVTVQAYQDDDDAIRIANDSTYGLAGSILTNDIEKAVSMARRIRTGTVGVNSMGVSYETPFGGFKDSGIGRCRGREGLDEYLEYKTISLPW